uniref:Glycosyltransferase 61 catalytic domain-containing protein n=2 Tax=Rhizophora mucronata TaxID=61149 RepID=A0A2P2JS81_RHIMU
MNGARRSRLLGIVLFLFAFNFFTLLTYWFHHHANGKPPPQLKSSSKTGQFSTENRFPQTGNRSHQDRRRKIRHLKPWPILPSYLPWNQNPGVPFHSCEAYFGNGFTRRIDFLHPAPATLVGVGGGTFSSSSSRGGWFRCFYSETLRSSVCEGGSLRLVQEKMKMSRGGETIEEVMGRREEEELPEFEDGALEVLGFEKRNKKLVDEDFLDMYVPRGDISKHPMRGLIGSARVVAEKDFQCDQWIEEPVLFITRFEYANLFHTVTDWYSAYVASRVTGLPYRPHVLFVDGHCRTPLEETWRALLSSLTYAKHLSGSVCYRHAVLVPLGYETPLFKGLSEEINCEGASAHDLWQKPDDKKTARLSEFGEMIRSAFSFHVNRHSAEKPVSGHNVLFVRRENYLAHPRHGGNIESRLSNEEEVFEALRSWASSHLECKVNIVNGLFAHMPLKEQVRAIQEASVIIGAHGAGLTHIVSATPQTVILEIISSYFRRPHFQLIARWKGLEYHAINLSGSTANPEVVIERLGKIVKSLGC